MVEYLRSKSYGTLYATGMSPPCAQQALAALELIRDKGETRISNLSRNSNYFRLRLVEEGFHIFGDHDSPVVLMMLYQPASMAELSRRLLENGVLLLLLFFFFLKLMLTF